MGHMKMVLRFGWPYLKRYWVRLVLGVAIGMLFGLTNASFVWATKTIMERLDTPATNTGAATVPNEAAVATQTEPQIIAAANGEAIPAKVELKPKRGAKLKAQVNQVLDPWLPKMGRDLDWRQI